jgi:hypothetical protein
MTLRERFADWISGGALSDAELDVKIYKFRMKHFSAQMDIAHARIDAALAEIDRQKAPNATVRRIGKMLRGEQ